MAKVKVKLSVAAYVGGRLVPAGETVEVPEEIAEEFRREGFTLEALLKLSKARLLELAGELFVAGVTKDNNKDEIAAKILEAKK